jgi:hypothetical protein
MLESFLEADKPFIRGIHHAAKAGVAALLHRAL